MCTASLNKQQFKWGFQNVCCRIELEKPQTCFTFTGMPPMMPGVPPMMHGMPPGMPPG